MGGPLENDPNFPVQPENLPREFDASRELKFKLDKQSKVTNQNQLSKVYDAIYKSGLISKGGTVHTLKITAKKAEDPSDLTVIVDGKIRLQVKGDKVVDTTVSSRGLFSNVGRFFRFISRAFYSPPILQDQEKLASAEKVQRGFSSLRNQVKYGLNWISGYEEKNQAAVKGLGKDPVESSHAALLSLDENGKEVERALVRSRPKERLAELASEFNDAIMALKPNEKFLFPTGYLNGDGKFQPVIMEWSKVEEGYRLVIYNDQVSAQSKVNPRIEIAVDLLKLGADGVTKVIDNSLAMLLEEDPSSKKQRRAVAGGEMFEELGRAALPREKGQKAPVEDEAAQFDFPFIEFLEQINGKSGVKEISQPAEAVPRAQRGPAGLSIFSFESFLNEMLAGQTEGKGAASITKEARLNLLFNLAMEWGHEQLELADKGKFSDERRLEIYRDIQRSLDHLCGEAANTLNGGVPLSDALLPTELVQLRKRCEVKIEQMQGRVMSERRSLAQASASKRHDTSIAATTSPVASRLVQESSGAGAAAAVAVPNMPNVQQLEAIKEARHALESSLDPSRMEVLQKDAIDAVYHEAQEALAALGIHVPSPEAFEGVDEGREFVEALCQPQVCQLIRDMLPEGRGRHVELSDEVMKRVLTDVMFSRDRVSSAGSVSKGAYGVEIQSRKEAEEMWILINYALTSNAFVTQEHRAVKNLLASLMMASRAFPQETKAQYEERKKREVEADILKIGLEEGGEVYNGSPVSDLDWNRSLEQLVGQLEDSLSNRAEPLSEKHSEITRACKAALILCTTKEIERDVAVPSADVDAVEPGEVAENLRTAVGILTELESRAKQEKDPKVKKALFSRVKKETEHVMRSLPAPGIEGTAWAPSFWNMLSISQCQEFREQIDSLNRLLFSSTMRVSENVPSGNARLQMLKGGALLKALMRREMDELLKVVPGDDEKFERTGSAVSVTPEPRRFGQADREQAQNQNAACHPDLLIMKGFTVPFFSQSAFLTQDLNANLSVDGESQGELMALLAFVKGENSRGVPPEGEKMLEQMQFDASLSSLDHLLEGVPAVEADYVRKVYGSFVKAMSYFEILDDPDFRLMSTDAELKPIPFLPSYSGEMLAKGEIDVELREGGLVFVAQGEPSGQEFEVRWRGKTDGPDAQKLKRDRGLYTIISETGRISILSNRVGGESQVADKGRLEHRTCVAAESISALILKKGEDSPLSIPNEVLERLLTLRGMDDNRLDMANYDAYTAIRALEFIADPSFTSYLKLPFVQKYLNDTLFGPFTLQKGLVSHPVEIFGLVGRLIGMAKNTISDPLLGTYFQNLLFRLNSEVKAMLPEMRRNGIFAANFTRLPASMYLDCFSKDVDGFLSKLEQNTQNSESIDLQQVKFFNEFIIGELEKIAQAIGGIDGMDRLPPAADAGIDRPIDRIADIGQKKLAFINLMERMRQVQSTGTDILGNARNGCDLLEGYRLLMDPDIDSALPELEEELIDWMQSEILPALIRDPLSSVALFIQKIGKIPEKISERDLRVEDHPFNFRHGGIELDLFTMTIKGIARTARERVREVPASLLERPEVQQAVGLAPPLKAAFKKVGDTEVYSWTNQKGESFRLYSKESIVVVQRTVISGNFMGNYTFVPVLDKMLGKSSAELLLGQYGVWKNDADHSKAYIFTDRTNAPESYNTYQATFSEDDKKVVKISTMSDNAVIGTPYRGGASPLLFASLDDIIVSVDSSGRPSSYGFKGLPVRIEKQKEDWNLNIRGNLLGKLVVPQNEQELVSAFGEHWDQYVVPFQPEGSSEVKYFVLSYAMERMKGGKLGADQSLEGIAEPLIMSLQKGVGAKGDMRAELFLAKMEIERALHERNPTLANALRASAHERIERLKLQTLPSDKKEIEDLAIMLKDLWKHNPVRLAQKPSYETIALGIQLGLMAGTLLRRGVQEGKQPMAFDEREQFAGFEELSRLYDTYGSLKGTADDRLSEHDLDELSKLSGFILHSVVQTETPYGTLAETPFLSVPSMDRLDMATVVALMRMGKLPQEGVGSIKDLKNPLPLDRLLENFWTYLLEIQTGKITSDQLGVLFRPSVISSDLIGQERVKAELVDLQLRQLLLSYGEVNGITEGKTPLEFVNKKLSEQFGKTTSEDVNKAKTALEQCRPGSSWSADYGKLMEEVQKIRAKGSASNPIHPDFNDLNRQIETVNVALLNVRKGLSSALADAKTTKQSLETTLSNIRKVIDKKESEIEELSTQLEEIEVQSAKLVQRSSDAEAMLDLDFEVKQETTLETRKERIIAQIKKLQLEIAGQHEELDKVLQKEIPDPISQETMSIETFLQIADGSIRVLKSVVDPLNALDEGLKEIKKSIGDLKGQLVMLGKLEDLLTNLSKAEAQPRENFELPSKGHAAELIRKGVAPSEEQQTAEASKGDLFLVGLSALRRVGLDNLRLMEGLKPAYDKVKDIDVTKPESFDPSQFGMENEGERMFAVVIALNGIGFAAHELAPTIEMKGREKAPAFKPLELDKEKLSTVFTEEEIAKIEEKLENSDTKDKATYVDQINRALQTMELSGTNLLAMAGRTEAIGKKADVVLSRKVVSPQQLQNERVPFDQQPKFDWQAGYGNFFGAVIRPEETKSNKELCQELIEALPQEESAFKEQLAAGIKSVENSDPLGNLQSVKRDQLVALSGKINSDLIEKSKALDSAKHEILDAIRNSDVTKLPKEIVQLRRRGVDDETKLMEAVYRCYQRGDFAKTPEIDKKITRALILESEVKALTRAVNEKMGKLVELAPLMTELDKDIGYERSLQKEFKDIFADPIKLQAYLRRNSPLTEQQAKELLKKSEARLESHLASRKAREIEWNRLSSEVADFTNRCQMTGAVLDKMSEGGPYALLAPHLRKILFMQLKTGYVLRENQLDTLVEIIQSPSLLRQLRMGLGKTSTIFPLALQILAAEGKNMIGMVPKALFDSNFSEMDEISRYTFESAGAQLRFSREIGTPPYSIQALHQITKAVGDFVEALARKEFVLTTIESKASLDNKLVEIRAAKNALVKSLKTEDSPDKRMELQHQIREHELAIDVLYKAQKIFTCDTTYVIVDEADTLLRPTYSVNSEMGDKEKLDPLLVSTSSDVFDIINSSNVAAIALLKEAILANGQNGLSIEQVQDGMTAIGLELLKKFNLPDGPQKKNLLIWLAGGKLEDPERVRDSMKGDFARLCAYRKITAKFLPSSLRLKVGNTTDFDPVNHAIGVPAQASVVSKTTKYSDPMMQLVLTRMVAMRKVQGEEFLDKNAPLILQELKRRHATGPSAQSAQAVAFLEDCMVKKGSDPAFTYREALNWVPEVEGQPDPGEQNAIRFLIRQLFVDQAANSKLIYLSGQQISRGVQSAMQGCHLIAMTGTATMSLQHLVAEKNPGGKGIESLTRNGRETTAEVSLRLIAALPEGMATTVQTYSTDERKIEQEFKEIANLERKGGRYNFFVNQAGACDHKTLDEIVAMLHESSGRPVVHMGFVDGRSQKCVRIGGQTVLLSSLSNEQKKEVADKGFYYYHTPHTRGTDFPIPIGSKGAVLLSPDVNVNDRDQAFYRARQLGEGHTVEPYISEGQKKQLKPDGGDVTLKELFDVHHQNSVNFENKEDLPAYFIAIKGALDSANRNILQDLRGGAIASRVKEWDAKTLRLETKIAAFEEIIDRANLMNSGIERYMGHLEDEAYEGVEEKTQTVLLGKIAGEIAKINRLREAAVRLFAGDEFKAQLSLINGNYEAALKVLEDKRKEFTENWAAHEKVLPAKTSGSPNEADQTAEAEAEEEQESTSESESETESSREAVARDENTKKLLEQANDPAFKGMRFCESQPIRATNVADIFRHVPPKFGDPGNLLFGNCAVSSFLRDQMETCLGDIFSTIRVVVLQNHEGKQYSIAIHSNEAEILMSKKGPMTFREIVDGNSLFPIGNFKLFRLETDTSFLSAFGDRPCGENIGLKDDAIPEGMRIDADKQRGMMGLMMLKLGFKNGNEQFWRDISHYWESLGEEAREEIRSTMTEALSSLPETYNKLERCTWGAPALAH